MFSLRKTIAAFAVAAVVATGLAVADGVTTKKSTTTKKKSSSKGSSAAQKKTPAKKGVASTKKRGTSTKSRSVQSWRTRQTQPTPDRYKEIQQALVKKGYLSGEPSGVWDQQSIDALRRFQQDQKLESTGKIDSLSLIALGLGPKHETAAAKPPAAQPPAN